MIDKINTGDNTQACADTADVQMFNYRLKECISHVYYMYNSLRCTCHKEKLDFIAVEYNKDGKVIINLGSHGDQTEIEV